MNIQEIQDKFKSTPYIVAQAESVSKDKTVNFFLASLPDNFQKSQSLRDKKSTADKFYVCQWANSPDDIFMCETHPDASDFKDAEKYELNMQGDIGDQIPMSKYNQNMYSFKKSVSKSESNVKKFNQFINEGDGFGSSSAVTFASKIQKRDVYVLSKDGLDWDADSDFVVRWSIEPNYSKSGVNWINVSVQKVEGSIAGLDEDDNEAARIDSFDDFNVVIEFEFAKDGSIHCGAIDIVLDEKTIQIS